MVETVPTLSEVKGSPEGPTGKVYLMAALLASGQIFPWCWVWPAHLCVHHSCPKSSEVEMPKPPGWKVKERAKQLWCELLYREAQRDKQLGNFWPTVSKTPRLSVPQATRKWIPQTSTWIQENLNILFWLPEPSFPFTQSWSTWESNSPLLKCHSPSATSYKMHRQEEAVFSPLPRGGLNEGGHWKRKGGPLPL